MPSKQTFFAVFSLLSSLLIAEDFSAEQLDFFEKKIRPVLAERCYECHSSGSKKLKAHLQLDHREHMLKGGDTGAAIVPGDPDKSLLIETISYETPDLQMPPKGPISAESVEDFRKWIADGAAWPDETVPKHGAEGKVDAFDLQKRYAEHWSWRKIGKPAPPSVNHRDVVKSPIDQFVLSKVEQAGLLPAQTADKRTLIRRAYFDLIGLPPTPDQIAAFIDDASPEAFEKVIDELLASPHFGEKWARHWMDLVRYAETYGHEFDYPIDFAHEYRDYLIRAYNEDIPYDQFVTEHIAGDLINEPRRNKQAQFNESILGTAFWYFHEATHAPTDVLQDEADHMDNQIDVFGKSFLGLTISCARCHDHKFDAISTADYYALTTYLHSSARQEYPMDPGLAREAAMKKLLDLERSGKAELEKVSTEKIQKMVPSAYLLAAIELIKKQRDVPYSGNPWDGKVFDDFESGSYDKWQVKGNAFGKVPVGAVENQKIEGDYGKALANSFSKGSDSERGTLISEKFEITKPFVNFLIGGGAHKTTAFQLWVDGKLLLSSSGENNDKLTPGAWNVSGLIGKTVELRIVDEARGGWGHIEVDNITFADAPAAEIESLPYPGDTKVEQYAKAAGLDARILATWTKLFVTEEKSDLKPSGYLRKIIDKPTVARGVSDAHQRHVDKLNAYREDATVIASFSDKAAAEGWANSGFAFQSPLATAGIRLDEKAPFAKPGVYSSDRLGNRQNGTLRSPTFTITGEGIHVKARSEQLFARVVMDNYHMAKFSGLLFSGTIEKSKSSDGDSQWFSFRGSLKKYIGHKAFLEFVDKSGAAVEIEEIWMGPESGPPQPIHPVVVAVSKGATTIEEIAGNFDAVWSRAWDSLRKGEGSGDQAEILNWMVANGLFRLDAISPPLAEIIKQGEAINRALPADRFAIAMAEGTPEDGHVYIRGSHRKLGKPVTRRNLTALGGQGGDRLELAKQIMAPENPLAARVMVNRIWHHLFGRGIVPTVDDFGPMGREPSHPELLDYLASEFREQGWSVKQSIRQIVLSQTYQQASVTNPGLDADKVATTDPENILLYRMPVRRLQAEAIRDSVLAVSGRLDPKIHGPSVPTHRTRFMSGRGARGSGPLDGAGRRSLYGAVYRNFLSPLMLTFDQPGPFGPKGRRSVSNVPAQALALMNDPFVLEQTNYWVKNEKASFDSVEQRIAAMYEKALGIQPGQARVTALKGFYDQQLGEHKGAGEKAWADLAHVLINMKDFIYLR